MIQDLSEIPIPVVQDAPTTASSASISFDCLSPKAREELVDLQLLGLHGRNYYGRTDGQNPPYNRPIEGALTRLLARQSVGRMLLEVSNSLSALGLTVFVFDAYRPMATQFGLWTFFRDRVAAESPGQSDDEIDRKTQMFVSDPRPFDPQNSSTWPLHSTGGAVDVTLVETSTQAEQDLGARFDDFTEASHTDYFERLLLRGRISETDPRLRNRRILYWAMRTAGFTNYPYEYWHYDYGNQMYVLSLKTLGLSGPQYAWYPYVTPASGEAS